MSLSNLLDRYRQWLSSIDAVFDRVRDSHPDAIPCHGGCSRCCYALFAVPPIDGALILYGLQQMSKANSEPMITRCRDLFGDFQRNECPEAVIPFRVEPIGWKEFEGMAERFQRPCPFLTDTGWCGIYEWRPKICRLAGTVFRDPVSGIELPDFCPVALEARNATGFQSAPMDLAALDGEMLEFNDAFRQLVGDAAARGHTFPAAGVLEAFYLLDS